ncbi:unnamed protein product [Adineta steineri]|uniref:Uncharacterized protein n=1 Tax=Adineta steineri TaxID=433720 RepID=A0A815SGK5_9BILA|nr:unnamed protein product [Adineta steineri]CAF3777291.1 unnamed protein product [Adineta steineri]
MKKSNRKKFKTKIQHNIKNDFFDIYNFIKTFLRFFIYSFIFWFLGRYGFSLIWLFLIAFIQTIERRFYLLRLERIKLFQELTTDIRPTIEKHLKEFPSWISYPDFDRCEWLNKLIAQMWPIISDYVQNLIKKTIEPEIKKQISGLSFERIDLGDFPPRLGGIKIYTDNIRSDEIILDTEFFYGGDMQIKMKYHSLKAGIKSLYLHGELRLILKSIVSKIPFIGALEIFFLRTPTIDFDLTDIANIIEIPGLHNLLMLTLERILQTFIVTPNRLIIAFMNEIDINQLKFPKPDGILRIDIIEAKNLPKLDNSFIITKHSIDAYVTISIGQYKFKTHTQRNNNPKWYETFEVPVEESNTQKLQISVFDADLGTDDYIGTINIPIESIKDKHDVLDQWYDLIGTKNSTIHIRMNWFYLSTNRNYFPEIQQMNQEHIHLMLSKISHTLSTSLLIVYIERIEQLPSIQHGKNLEPYPFCLIKIDNYEEKTSIIKNSINPRWMKSFMFMLVNPEQSLLQININDSNNKNHLIGTVEISIKNLMEEKDWISNRFYPLKNSPNTKLYLKLQLQIMTKSHPNRNQLDIISDITPSSDDTQSYNSIDNKIQSKRSKIQIHLINKHNDQRILNQHKSSPIKKLTFFQTLFSSCIKKCTTTSSSMNNNFIKTTYGFW